MWGHWKDVKSDYESKVNDPWDWVTHFENAIARYTGSTHAIACDSNSNAILLCLEYLKQTNQILPEDEPISIPSQTYCSVPNAIIRSNHRLIFQEREWFKHYRLGTTPIFDCAVSLYEGMYNVLNKGSEVPSLAILSFHHRKIINIGQGGMILTNDDEFNEWARPMIYDGRRKYFKYDTDVLQCIGWHMYMTPEQAKRGLEIFHSEEIDSKNTQKTKSYKDYTNLSKQPVYSEYDIEKSNYPLNMAGDFVLNKFVIDKEGNKIYDYLFNLESRNRLISKFKEKEWSESLDKIDFYGMPDSMNFVIYDDVEFFGIWEENKIIKFLIDYFDSKNLVKRLKFYGNHLDVKISDNRFNYEGTPFFIGDTCHLSRVIEPKLIKFSKTFLSANSYPKLHRVMMQIFLQENNLLEKCHYSWNPNKISPSYLNGFIKKYPFLSETKGLSDFSKTLTVPSMHTCPEEWYDSFCAIICESRYHSEEMAGIIKQGDSSAFITEKTEKCFTVGIPFIMVSTPGFLKKLKEIGFKTFDKWWDESYDDIEHDIKRFQAIQNIILEISEWDTEKIEKVYSEMKETLRWNQVLNIALNNENKKIKRTRNEYLSFLRWKPLPYQNAYDLKSPYLVNKEKYHKLI